MKVMYQLQLELMSADKQQIHKSSIEQQENISELTVQSQMTKYYISIQQVDNNAWKYIETIRLSRDLDIWIITLNYLCYKLEKMRLNILRMQAMLKQW